MKFNYKSLICFFTLLICVCSFLDSVHANTTTNIQSVESSYTVKLPKSIDMGTATIKGFDYTVDGKIEEYEQVKVEVDKTYSLRRMNDVSTSVHGTATITKTIYESDMMNTKATGTVISNPTKAGEYSGNVTFHASIERREDYIKLTYDSQGGVMLESERFLLTGNAYGTLPTPRGLYICWLVYTGYWRNFG